MHFVFFKYVSYTFTLRIGVVENNFNLIVKMSNRNGFFLVKWPLRNVLVE